MQNRKPFLACAFLVVLVSTAIIAFDNKKPSAEQTVSLHKDAL